MESVSNLDTWVKIDQTLASICKKCPYLADDILEFRFHARSQTQPGRCVRAYFDFASSLCNDDEICCLRNWLESTVEVEAVSKQCTQLLESFPFKVADAYDLQGYCMKVIRSMHHDRSYKETDIKLQFRYR
ncbi:MAG: hypothetical protein AAF984_04360 [Verrucomicrobiota bacterium]